MDLASFWYKLKYTFRNFGNWFPDLDAIAGPRAEGRTALHVAAEHGHAANVAVLVDAGANLLIRDHLGLTPLDLADKAEHAECMSVLRAAADKQVSLLLLMDNPCLTLSPDIPLNIMLPFYSERH